jgi:hypothetical protein
LLRQTQLLGFAPPFVGWDYYQPSQAKIRLATRRRGNDEPAASAAVVEKYRIISVR